MMSKVAVVFWSGTGNTQTMAEAVADGAKAAGADVSVYEVSGFSADQINDFDAIAFGCPAMGDEELEEGEFQPFFDSCKEKLSGRKIALFGSYGWGDGEWMRNWEADCKAAGAVLAAESVMANDAPDDTAVAACKELGSALA
jgi:flavodoxin short chain